MHAELVIDLIGIAARHAIQRAFGQIGLDPHYGSRIRSGFFGGLTQELKHFRQVRQVLFADLGRFRVLFQIVVSIGKR